MRAVLYARVSSAVQRDRETIAAQLRLLPEYIAARGWTLARPATTYVDDGLTAADSLPKRAGMLRLLADAAARAFDVVVVMDFDRITRAQSLAERGLILDAFRAGGVRIVSSRGQEFDLQTEGGELMATLEAHAAASWLNKHKQRIKEGKLLAISRGKKPAGPTPYGFLYDRATGVWSIDPATAPVVREIFERAARGEGAASIGADLEERAVPRPRSGHWIRSRAFQIVVNPCYRGEWTADKRRHLVVRVPAIVSDELWSMANAMLSARPLRRRRQSRYSLLEGIAICGECGGKIGINGSGATRRDGQRFTYYICETTRVPVHLRHHECRYRMRDTRDVDALVWARVRAELERPNLVAELLAQRASAADQPALEADLASYERQLAALERAEATILDRFRRGQISDGAMDRETAAAGRHRALLVRNRDVARQGLASARRGRDEADALRASLATLRARLSELGPQERQALVRRLVPGRDGLHATIDALGHVELAGHIDLGRPARTFSAGAAFSSSERSECGPIGLRFRVVARGGK